MLGFPNSHVLWLSHYTYSLWPLYNHDTNPIDIHGPMTHQASCYGTCYCHGQKFQKRKLWSINNQFPERNQFACFNLIPCILISFLHPPPHQYHHHTLHPKRNGYCLQKEFPHKNPKSGHVNPPSRLSITMMWLPFLATMLWLISKGAKIAGNRREADW